MRIRKNYNVFYSIRALVPVNIPMIGGLICVIIRDDGRLVGLYIIYIIMSKIIERL